MGELDGQVAIVTGAGRLRGIGRAAAVALAELGADVVVTGTGRDPSTFPPDEQAAGWRDIESTAEEVRAHGVEALALAFDVRDETAVNAAVARALEEFGRIDILVNNAAASRGEDRTPIVELTPELFDLVLDVKVRGSYLITRAVAAHLIERGDGGAIVNVASTAGKRGSANTLAYNAANFAMVGMTQSLARELGPHGVNVNCVCPGAVDTSRMDSVRPGDYTLRESRAEAVSRWGTDEEVGDFIAYLCTSAAAWIHGQSININGGSVMEH